MPIYEYECGHCQDRFEVRQGFDEKHEAVCPQCNKKARRVFHSTPIIFKGSGFYVTDHKKTNSASAPSKGKTEAS